jgi:hypothetical protein
MAGEKPASRHSCVTGASRRSARPMSSFRRHANLTLGATGHPPSTATEHRTRRRSYGSWAALRVMRRRSARSDAMAKPRSFLVTSQKSIGDAPASRAAITVAKSAAVV